MQQIRNLINQLDDDYQTVRLQRAMGTGTREIFYLGYDKVTRTVFIRGTADDSGNRSEYKLRVSEGGKISCNCPDSRGIALRNKVVCKHVAFLVCRVGKIYSVYYFKNAEHKLNKKDLDHLLSILDNQKETKAPDPKKIRLFLSSFKVENTENLDPCCICLDDCGEEDALVKCIRCSQIYHQPCISIWLERNATCAYCRSQCFKYYESLYTGEKGHHPIHRAVILDIILSPIWSQRYFIFITYMGVNAILFSSPI